MMSVSFERPPAPWYPEPGAWHVDRRTRTWVQVVYGAQPAGHVTVRMPYLDPAGCVGAIRVADLDRRAGKL
jgi:hypothetical protein